MIGKLSGTLSEKNPPQVLVDCHGVGYEVDVPMSTFYNLPETGQVVTLLTHFVVREDAQILYGFASAEDTLGFTNENGISGSYNATTGVLTLSGTATVAQYQAALRSVTYANSSDAPSAASRTVSFQVTDGAASSNALAGRNWPRNRAAW